MANKLYYETFPDIYKFMYKIQARENNGKFGTDSHDTGEWYGTDTWETAIDQFTNGIPEVAEKLKAALTAFTANANIVTTKRTPQKYYYGYAPNIPAAIIGLPKAMHRIERQPQKTKTIGLLWNSCQNCGTSADTLRQSGETVLQLVYLLERKGYRVQLDSIPFSGRHSERDFVAIINLKQYSQHMDIMKLTFPVTSPAMFRRFGFNWAEGIPGVTGERVSGYGRHIQKPDLLPILEKQGYNIKSTYCIDVNDCEEAEFDPVKVAENLGIII